MNMCTLSSRIIVLLLMVLLSVAPSMSQEYVLVGWNDLGMHCANKGFSKIAVLPPFNNVTAQLLLKQPGQQPQIVSAGVTIEYSIPNNTFSVGKTDFWSYAQQLFGLGSPLPPNIGLAGKGLTGVLDSSGGYFIAHGIPVTPFADSDLVNETPFQLIHLVAKRNSDGAVLATTDAVIPVSNEVGCVQSGCHSSETDILNSHEDVAGFNRAGPVLCASCHASNALGTTGTSEARPFSYRIHGAHSSVAGPSGSISTCYKCHPGPNTQCLRDIMGKNSTNPLVCQNCHGTLDSIATSIADGRRPWLDEPKCGHCHGSAYAEEAGKLYRQSTGHGGLFCSACHGSPHAIQPTVQPNDNLQNIRLQGFAGTLRKCSVCHSVSPPGPGPHGLIDTSLAAPASPLLSLPADGAINQQLLPLLRWSPSFSADNYRVQVAADTGWSVLLVDDSSVVDTERHVGPLSIGMTYYWRACAKNINGWGGWSARWRFTTAAPPPAPVLVWPPDTSSGTPTTLRLRWNTVPTADYYTVQLGSDTMFISGLVLHGPSSDTGVYAYGLTSHALYYWRVRSVGIGGTGVWSVESRFTTGDTTFEARISLVGGWNLISMPMTVPERGKDAIFPNATSRAFTYEGTYVARDTLQYGSGYWLKFGRDSIMSVYGQFMGGSTVDMHPGWNIIGSVSSGVWIGSVTSDPPGLTISGFFTYAGGYAVSDTIQPGYGYWVKVNQPGRLFLLASHPFASSARIQIVPDGEAPPSPPGEDRVVRNDLPRGFFLEQNNPNPFNPSTVIKYQIPGRAHVKLSVFDMLGREVGRLVDGIEDEGYRQAIWSAIDMSSGIYFYRLEAVLLSDPGHAHTKVRKMLLVR